MIINTGTVGVLTAGNNNRLDDIRVNINQIKESDADVATAFSKLQAAIQDSKAIPSEEERSDLLDTLDGLTKTAAAPAEDRGSLVGTAIRGFSKACNAVSDISDVWTNVEGPIKSFFGVQ